MIKHIRNVEDYKRAVLDLYDAINLACNTNDVCFLRCVSDEAINLIDQIRVYRSVDILEHCKNEKCLQCSAEEY